MIQNNALIFPFYKFTRIEKIAPGCYSNKSFKQSHSLVVQHMFTYNDLTASNDENVSLIQITNIYETKKSLFFLIFHISHIHFLLGCFKQESTILQKLVVCNMT